MRAAHGFTLIELVIVIGIMAILAAVALPRMVDISEDAHNAANDAMFGSVATGVELVHAKWTAQGGGVSVALEGATVDVSTPGWPGLDVVNSNECGDVFNALLMNPPPLFIGVPPGLMSPGWWTVGGNSPGLGPVCYFVYGRDITPFRFLRYRPGVGEVIAFP